MKRSDSFDENEKKQMLQALLQSKDPRDLAAANALIKEMVKQVCPCGLVYWCLE